MLNECQYTYPSSGKVFVCVDGPEILVYSGNDDGPLWKYFCEELVVGVGVTSEEVYALESVGRLVKLRLVNGEFLDYDDLGMQPTGMMISDDEVIAVIGSERLFVRHPGAAPMTVAISGVVTLGFGPTGGSLGLGTESGEFYAVDTVTGGAWGSVNLGGPVCGVAWSAQQYWLAGVGSQVHCISGDGTQILETIDAGGTIQSVACSLDGSMVAVLTNNTHVRIFEWLNKSLAGNIWFQRTVSTLAFGPSSWLGLGHDEGDANRVDLFTGQMTRTQAHEGRGQHAWPMQVEINSALLRGTSTTLKAGASPIAVQVRSQENEKKRSGALIWAVLALMFGFLVVSVAGILFCGLSGPLMKGPKYYFSW